MPPLLECVPNFSEGRDSVRIRRITDAIEAVDGVTLLNVDPGPSTNRTVVTFVGEPEPVVVAAFEAIRVAAQVIDMREHHGEHPRMGATDVCPLVPVSGISLKEAADLARALGQRVGEELRIPVYLYEAAATRPERVNLAAIRAGEYEGLAAKLADPAWVPDYGPATFLARSGATVIGARDFLIAYNVNLNTTSTRRANAVAFDVREKGRVCREGGTLTGEVIRDGTGTALRDPGSLEGVKAIGWYLPEHDLCQVSMNITDIKATPLHLVFEETAARARARGMRATGSEIVGMVPLRVLREAGEFYLRRQQRSLGIPEREVIDIAARSLGLAELAPFDPEEKVIEAALAARHPTPGLLDLTVTGFADAVASEAPTPGGGSAAALVGALGAALGAMVANGSAHKRGWDDRWETFSDWAVRGRAIQEELLELVDADAEAFDALIAARRLPKATPEGRAARLDVIQTAIRATIDVPLRTMRAAVRSMDVALAMAEIGNPNAASDAAVAALCARAAVRGAYYNVRINLSGVTDAVYLDAAVAEAESLLAQAADLEQRVLSLVEARLG